MKATKLTSALFAAAEACNTSTTGTTPLRKEADKKGVLIGSGAINPTYLGNP